MFLEWLIGDDMTGVSVAGTTNSSGVAESCQDAFSGQSSFLF